MRFYFEGEKNIYLFLGAGLVLVSLTALVFIKIIMPNIKTWRSLKNEVGTRQTELARRQSTIQENVRLREEILNAKNFYDNYTNMLFPTDDAALVVKELTNVTKNLKIEFNSIQPLFSKTVTEMPEYAPFFLKQMLIVVKMKADYLELIKFLERLEESSKFLKIENFRMIKNKDNPPTQEMEITLNVFSASKKLVSKNDEAVL